VNHAKHELRTYEVFRCTFSYRQRIDSNGYLQQFGTSHSLLFPTIWSNAAKIRASRAVPYVLYEANRAISKESFTWEARMMLFGTLYGAPERVC
jgi:hypothetical protein